MVLADTDTDSDDEDDDDDDDDDDDGGRALMGRLLRRGRSKPKHHGTVRVQWSDDSDPSRVRVGRDGRVDVWCLDSAPGGQFYRDHLGLLDGKIVSTAADDDDDDDDNDEVWVAEAAGVADSIRTRTPLGTPL